MDNIDTIINEWDPIELLDFCPKDEYESEIFEIRIRSRGMKDKQQLAKLIFDVFTKSFDNDFKCSLQDCMDIASKIYLG